MDGTAVKMELERGLNRSQAPLVIAEDSKEKHKA